ncbi:hypothetical protein [Baia soyae]|uniref:Uncharacterized protein n=1 Tax=Baia soyae TaxID=1544746 RepID=A0A4R2RJT0_9BACL|nr:hypothetical protein [Baia soyae]TCP64122.1 hypothetical protein EDD57_1437 [Baia soyae]
MSQPNIPNITPIIEVTTHQAINLLLSSIAMEELAHAHIVNAEAEKIQYALGTLHDCDQNPCDHHHRKTTLTELLCINDSVDKILEDVIYKEMLLQFKFHKILCLINNKHAFDCDDTICFEE